MVMEVFRKMATTAWQKIMTSVRRTLRRFEDVREEHASTFTIRVAVEADELDGGYIATVLDMPGCISQGETQQEAAENALDAFAEMIATVVDSQIEEEQSSTTITAAPRIREYKVAVGC